LCVVRHGRGLVVLDIQIFDGKGWGTGVPGAFGQTWARLLPPALIPLFSFHDLVPEWGFGKIDEW